MAMGKRSTYIIIILLLLTFATEGCSDIPFLKNLGLFKPKLATPIYSADIDQLIPNVLNVPPEEMRTALNNAYRLKPDKRFLLAVIEIHYFMTQKKAGKASALFIDGKWEIQYGNFKVGTLPELPKFSDFLRVLSDWTLQLQKISPLKLTDLPLAG